MAIEETTLALSAALLIYFILRASHKSQPLRPPGPRPLPLLGNLFDWPFEAGWLKFTEWSKIYGDMIYVQIFGLDIIILSDAEECQDLMNRAIYSDRPHLMMVGELMGFAPSTILAPYGDHWKASRKLAQPYLSKSSCRGLWPSFEADSRCLLRSLMDEDACYQDLVQFILGKSIIENTYGIPIDRPDDYFVKISKETHEAIQHAVVPGSFLVDIFPSMRYIPEWFPGGGFKRLGRFANERRNSMIDEPFDRVRDELAQGKPNTSLVSGLLQDRPTKWNDNLDYEYVVKWASGTLYGAAVETASSALSTFLLMMIMHPEVQHKAQQEIDLVTGGTRLPTLADQEHLPYVEAIMKETLRFSPPAPLGIARRLMQDDIVKERTVPGGSIVIPNVWAMSRNEKYYKNGSEFNPERFIDHGQGVELDPTSLVFGFGRRACQGVHYATAAMFIHMASILSVFSASHGGRGEDMPAPKFTGGFVSHPLPFAYKLTPRSEKTKNLVLEKS